MNNISVVIYSALLSRTRSLTVLNISYCTNNFKLILYNNYKFYIFCLYFFDYLYIVIVIYRFFTFSLHAFLPVQPSRRLF